MLVKRIYQLADIHIPTYQKLDMYATQLGKVTGSIEEDFARSGLAPEEARIVICGDLVHSKNLVTNELNTFASTFIRQLASIAKVICIAGNHDIVESSSARMDTLSGIFQTAQFDNAVYLDMALGYESGVVYDDNITWALYSFFDEFNTPDIEAAREEHPDNKVIGLFHGTIIGTKLFNGFVSDCGTDSDAFDGCDCVMAGHIHKRQVVKCKTCDIVYSGSPMQQNYGESITQHGYVKWDLEEMKHEFVDVGSDYGYYDFSISSIDDITDNKEILNNY